MQSCRDEAIVLGVTEYRESDKLVTLFAREHGKLRGIARGAKRSMRRFGGALEIFARIHIQVVVRQGLSTVSEADPVTVYPAIRGDLAKIGLAGYACELVDRMLPEAMVNPRLFRLLAAYLEHLDAAPPASSDRRFFEVNLLNILGYRPAVDHCSGCGTDIAAGSDDLVLAPDGFLLCRECGRGGKRISASAVGFLDRALRTGRFDAVSPAAAALSDAGMVLDAAIGAHLDRPLKALAFLREVFE